MNREAELAKLAADPDPAVRRWAEIDMLPDEQEACSVIHSNGTIRLVVLRSNRIAIFGQDGQLYKILDDAPSTEELRRLSEELRIKLSQKSAAWFYGEPSDSEFKRDLKRAERAEQAQTRRRNIPSPAQVLDI